MQFVLDTDVLAAALRSPNGASAELVRLARHGLFMPVISVPLVLEYEAVCLRPEHLLATGLSPVEVLSVVDMLVDKSHRTKIHFRHRPLTRDPSDEMVLETALNGNADAIVTFNLKDYGSQKQRLGMECLLPRQALRRVKHG